jgi:hypothetical protein
MKMIVKGVRSTLAMLELKTSELTEKQLKKTVRRMTKDLSYETPVDTGKARDSWSSSCRGKRCSIRNNTEYIEHLNEGSSKQAPKYFIEATCLKYGRPLGIVVQVK